MQSGKARAGKRVAAKQPRRAAGVPKLSRPAPHAVSGTKPSRAKPLALGDLSQLLGYSLRRAQLWIFREFSRQLAAFEISPAQFSVLCVIDANPGVNQLAVAQLLSIERAGLGRLVDHLEGRGLVRRTASAINRRYYVLYLTETGTALLDRLKPAAAASDEALAAKIGPRAYKELQRALSIFVGDA
ncbi:MarR family transcriptional regulator [Bradyrhizobium manausense]|uniref:MarR family winged helix-turn-helix transcriptional regulator n=1 Tax=Bradyrhizobium manausense TaxID=989370 RepID=UPI001BA5EFF7|nr:MarR family transcriptional regulator [Bradyrhizobium manausense]MBR0687119.1 MarR family transcriptional regulator [Bradyrhizobium manausense]